MASIADIAFSDLETELAQTRRILERVPGDRFSWAPHEKSMTLGRLASHVAALGSFAQMMIEAPDVDLASTDRKAPPDATDHPGLLALFDATAASLREAIRSADDARFSQKWTLSFGQHVIYSGPRHEAVRRLGIDHIVHHRGQLSVYLRLLDVPVPGMFGPSADER